MLTITLTPSYETIKINGEGSHHAWHFCLLHIWIWEPCHQLRSPSKMASLGELSFVNGLLSFRSWLFDVAKSLEPILVQHDLYIWFFVIRPTLRAILKKRNSFLFVQLATPTHATRHQDIVSRYHEVRQVWGSLDALCGSHNLLVFSTTGQFEAIAKCESKQQKKYAHSCLSLVGLHT